MTDLSGGADTIDNQIALPPFEGDKKRLAIFLPSLEKGGLERMMVNLAKGFAALGVYPDFVVKDPDSPYLKALPDQAASWRKTGKSAGASGSNLSPFLPHKRRASGRRDYHEYYDDDTALPVNAFFKKDIETFGYSFRVSEFLFT